MANGQTIPLGDGSTNMVTHLVRIEFNLDGSTHASLHATHLSLFAEGTYIAWINGAWLGRGPAYHHPGRKPLDRYDLSAHLRTGRNVVAVVVHHPGISIHNAVPSLDRSVTAMITRDGIDGPPVPLTWKTTNRSGWLTDVPRRSWAIGYVESFDANLAPDGWQSPDFDASAWDAPTPVPTSLAEPAFEPRSIPPLRYAFQPVGVINDRFATRTPTAPIAKAHGSADFGKQLMAIERDATAVSPVVEDVDPTTGAFIVRGLTAETGFAVCFDLGQEWTGQVTFECASPTAGVIDIGWSEVFENGSPTLVRKGGSYCDRFHAKAGINRWHPVGYSAMRFVTFILRGFTGDVRFRRCGVLASEPDLSWSASFSCSDAKVNAVVDLCLRTQRVGTQDGPLDCPTREQAPYIGDGLIVGRWIAMLTGDTRLWRMVVDEQFHRPNVDGLIRASIFSGSTTVLIDYTLLAVMGLRDYWRATGETALVARWLESCRRIVQYFENTLDPVTGLCLTEAIRQTAGHDWDPPYDPANPPGPREGATILFIDHPGMGWHNINEPGIDRRGVNCAINALLVQAHRALAELETTAGEANRAAAHRSRADRLAAVVRERFFDAQRGLFIDGVHEGQPLAQISEQTNTWAIAAGCCDDDEARAIITKLLNDPDTTTISRNGPYFWAYLFPEMTRLGMHTLAVEKGLARWNAMIDRGATTLWETFAGDHLDSWCHAWSGAPLEFALSDLAGLTDWNAQRPLRPRVDLFDRCSATVFTKRGRCTLNWQRDGKQVRLNGSLPPGVELPLLLPNGNGARKVRGEWSFTI